MKLRSVKKDRKYIPEIKNRSNVCVYIYSHKSGGSLSYNPDCDIVWERIRKRTDETAKIVKMEAEKCRKDEKYIPEIKSRSKVYCYVHSHKSSGKHFHNPDCDIIWDRIRNTRIDELTEIVKIEAEKCKKDINYRPEIKYYNKVYRYIKNHKSGSKFSYDPNCDIVWERKYTRTNELAEVIKIEAEKCRKDEKYIPEIKHGSGVYAHILNHKSGGGLSYNPDCDIIWERIKKNTGTDETAEIIKIEAKKCENDEKYRPEIKYGSKVYRYLQNHKLGGTCSHNPDCDIVWERMRKRKK